MLMQQLDLAVLMQQLGLAVMGVVLLQAVLFTLFLLWREWSSLRVLKQRLAWADQVAQVKRLAQEKSLQRNELMWNGFRKFEVREKVVESENKSICSFYLVPHDKKPLPPFFPGQFLTFQINLATPGEAPQAPVIRCYSLSDRPDPNCYRISIKKLPPPRDNPKAPPGLISNYFHDQVKQGDILDVKAPSGQFYLDTQAHQTPVVLIGGGVGLTPMVSMLSDLLGSGSQREIWFLYGILSGGDHIMRTDLEKLAKEHKNVHMHVAYSKPKKTDEQGKDYHHKGHIDVALMKSLLPSNNYAFYICGPPPMMSTLVPALEEWGVPESDIHYEAFGPATVIRKKTEVAPAPADGEAPKAIQVTFSKSGKTLDWDPSMDSLLAFADANEVVINSGCRVGNCNTCLTTVKAGEVDYIRKPDEEPQGGSCLTCISVPKGDLMLDA